MALSALFGFRKAKPFTDVARTFPVGGTAHAAPVPAEPVVSSFIRRGPAGATSSAPPGSWKHTVEMSAAALARDAAPTLNVQSVRLGAPERTLSNGIFYSQDVVLDTVDGRELNIGSVCTFAHGPRDEETVLRAIAELLQTAF